MIINECLAQKVLFKLHLLVRCATVLHLQNASCDGIGLSSCLLVGTFAVECVIVFVRSGSDLRLFRYQFESQVWQHKGD